MLELVITLGQTTLVILAFAFLFSLAVPRLLSLPSIIQRVVFGLILGLFGLYNMAEAYIVLPGVIVDIRNPILIVSSVFAGVLGAGITASIMLLYRVFIVGGPFVGPAILSMVPLIWFGVYWYRRQQVPTFLQWLLLGFLSYVVAIPSILYLYPNDAQDVLLRAFTLVGFLIYPVGTLMLGVLIQREFRRVTLNEDLRRSEQRFRALFDEAFQFIALLDDRGHILELNTTALQLCNTTADVARVGPLWEHPCWIYAADVQERLRNAVQQAVAGHFVRYHERVQGPDEKIIVFDFSLTPLYDDHGAVEQILAEGRDVTAEVKASERQLQLTLQTHKTEIVQRFIQDASHHLRTPLTVLKTTLFLIEKTAEPEPKSVAQAENTLQMIRKKLPVMGTAINDLAQLVNDLLKSADSSPSGERQHAYSNVTNIVYEQLTQYNDLVESSGLTLKVQAEPLPVRAVIPPADLRYVIQNLTENAIHYTPQGGVITVSIAQHRDFIELRVQDDGIGIDENELERIFERFYRTDVARAHTYRGSGLGLAIVKDKIDACRGKVSVQSKIGLGTTFIVHLRKIGVDALPETAVVSRTINTHSAS